MLIIGFVLYKVAVAVAAVAAVVKAVSSIPIATWLVSSRLVS